jgi:hypothetical protein
MSGESINLNSLPREVLLVLADRACNRLCCIANMLTTDEGDPEDTEEEFGLSVQEVIEGAHDNMICDARATLDSILRDIAAAREAKPTLVAATGDPADPGGTDHVG